MRDLFIISMTLISFIVNSYGQTKFGIKGGINYANVGSNSGDKDYDERVKNSTDFKYGYHAGIFMNFPLTEKLAIQPELLFSTQGRKTIDYTVFETQLNYLSLPLLLAIKPFEDFGLTIGPHFNYLQSAMYIEENSTYDASYIYDNNWDIGWTGGILVQVTSKLYLTARYKQGLSTLTKKVITTEEGGGIVTDNYKNRNQVIQIGFNLFIIDSK